MELDELRSFGFQKFIVDEVWRVLDVLDLFVRGRIVFGIECQSCCGLQVLSCSMQSASCDLRVIHWGGHSEGGGRAWS